MNRYLLAGLIPLLGNAFAETLDRANASTPSSTMAMAAQILRTADDMDARSRAYILAGSDLRKQLNKLRVEQRKLADDTEQTTLLESISVLVQQMDQWQQQGSELRQVSMDLHRAANVLFIDGFVAKWATWVSNSSPLVMDAVAHEVVAHNNKIRSIRPRLTGTLPAPMDMPVKHQGMSIAVPALAGQQVPGELNLSSFQISRDRAFFAHIEVQPENDESAAAVPLNKIHRWRLLVSDLNGNPVSGAQLAVEGHMPGHVHGLPTQPEVTEELAPGVYRVGGVKFQMNGWWVIQFNIDHQSQRDTVTFNLLL